MEKEESVLGGLGNSLGFLRDSVLDELTRNDCGLDLMGGDGGLLAVTKTTGLGSDPLPPCLLLPVSLGGRDRVSKSAGWLSRNLCWHDEMMRGRLVLVAE